MDYCSCSKFIYLILIQRFFSFPLLDFEIEGKAWESPRGQRWWMNATKLQYLTNLKNLLAIDLDQNTIQQFGLNTNTFWLRQGLKITKQTEDVGAWWDWKVHYFSPPPPPKKTTQKHGVQCLENWQLSVMLCKTKTLFVYLDFLQNFSKLVYSIILSFSKLVSRKLKSFGKF